MRKGTGKASDPMPALMALPGMDSDVVKKLRKRKITCVAGELSSWTPVTGFRPIHTQVACRLRPARKEALPNPAQPHAPAVPQPMEWLPPGD